MEAFDWEEVPCKNFCTVVDAARDQAISLLETHAIVKLSEAQRRLYAADQLLADKSRKAYLVRALSFTNRNGGFTVRQKQSSLWVRYGCLGHPGKVERTPLVVLLSEEPVSLFVDGGVAL
jgi:hypothetical protein